MNRALVTGATGFVGRAVVARLEAEGWETVRAVRTPIADPTGNTIVLGSAEWDQATFALALERVAPQVVFHLAGTVRGNNAADLYRTNTVLAANLLDAVQASASRPAVLLAGSAAEYGYLSPDQWPAKETGPCQPATDYGISKHAQTLLGMARAQTGMAVTVARIFNPVGVGMPQHLALASFAEQLRGGAERLLVGDLDVARDLIDVVEAARLIVALGCDPRHHGRVYNVCSGTPTSLRPLVTGLIALCRRPVQIAVDPNRLRPGETRVMTGDTSRLRSAGLLP
jgi:GDP-4-dehydro-6-deoxy-D-mannose reductase